jgi:hypothetical protein
VEAVFLSRGGGYPGTDIANELAIEKGEKDGWGGFFLNDCNGGDQAINYPPLKEPVPIAH